VKIFVVDDDAASRLLMVGQLDPMRHDIREFASGAELLAAADAAPDLILLDIEMPGMDGISLCRALRQAGDDHALILFISAHDDLDTRLAAYEAGGSDFLAKPFSPQELACKVQVAEDMLSRRAALSEQALYARNTAFTAMSAMGEMGAVLEFLRTSFSCRNAGELAAAMLKALHDFGLQGLVEIRIRGDKPCFSAVGECTPLEKSILGHASGMERLFQFRDRLAINYPGLTLLVLQLPLDDADRVGRLRDHLAILAEGAAARIQAMANEQQRAAQAEGILQAVGELTRTLASVEHSQAATRVQALQIDSEHLEALVAAFVHLGLTDDQENHLAEIAEHTHARLGKLMDDDYSIGDQLRAVAGRLSELSSSG